MNLSKDEMNFLDNVVFSRENEKLDFENWVESFECYLAEQQGKELFIRT